MVKMLTNLAAQNHTSVGKHSAVMSPSNYLSFFLYFFSDKIAAVYVATDFAADAANLPCNPTHPVDGVAKVDTMSKKALGIGPQ